MAARREPGPRLGTERRGVESGANPTIACVRPIPARCRADRPLRAPTSLPFGIQCTFHHQPPHRLACMLGAVGLGAGQTIRSIADYSVDRPADEISDLLIAREQRDYRHSGNHQCILSHALPARLPKTCPKPGWNFHLWYLRTSTWPAAGRRLPAAGL